MAMPSDARQAGWQSSTSHIHERPVNLENSITNLSVSDNLQSRPDVNNSPKPQGLSIRDIRMSMNQGQNQPQVKQPSPPESLMPNSMRSPSQAPFKKKSLFGGLFAVREPTQIALGQVAAQLAAQHGSTSATKVPNVRMEKMPDHVPKVNSKWDGIPDAIKQREKREKELAKAAKRQSLAVSVNASTTRSRSSEALSRPSDSRNSDRSDLSLGSRSGVHRHNSSRTPNPHRFYAQSVNSSGDLAAQLRDDSDCQSTSDSHPPSMQTSSSKSVAETAHKDAAKDPDTKRHSRKASSHRSRGQKHNEKMSHMVSPPRPRTADRSQASKQKHAQRITSEEDVVLLSSGHGVLPLPSIAKPKQPIQSNAAFLAGEAQEFQMPDDDSDDDQPATQARSSSNSPRPQNAPRRITDDTRPASANDFHNAQLRPKSTVTGRLGSLLKREN